ncbi:sensor domain-containing diguanylate cyclase [Bacillus alkalicola]|uniref:Sensor domain-containing diguanylate cyclase n=2 Tax=Bacillales TaxID=1385 RepID=A0ABS6JUZ0_9BACI|nr:sensor domain-containing diguanylate cyclase [Bacillus alkalicola]
MGLLVSTWIINNKYVKLNQEYGDLNATQAKLEEQLKVKTANIRDYEMLFHSLDGAVYSYDVINNENSYFSEGFVDVYGYSPESWKDIIHDKDKHKVEADEIKLFAGEPSKIEYRIHHPYLGERWVVKYSTPIIGSDGNVTKINGQIIDITFRKELENELNQMAYYDDLTDLPNRKALDKHITKALARSKRHHHNFSIMFIDLDDFKIVNDTMGHEAGDDLLIEVVRRLNESIREEDLVARLGGDEFIIVFEETNKAEIEDIANRIIENIALPYTLNDKEVKISLSIGISMYPDDGEDKETLIDNADKAMYFAKNKGKNNYKMYTPDLENIDEKVGLVEKIVSKFQQAKLFN